MENKTSVNNLIAMWNISDSFESFNIKLKEAMGQKYNREFLFDVFKVSTGQFCLSLKAKRFYAEHKEVIDTINTYTTFFMFVNEIYDWYGNVQNNGLLNFYDYLKKHDEEKAMILATLLRLKQLGFKEIVFDESLDFTTETFTVLTNYPRNTSIKFLGNMEAIPGYNSGVVAYKSNGSPYQITLDMHYRRISNTTNWNEIKLNSLIFDLDLLPEELSKETIYDVIMALKNAKSAEYTAVKDSVDLSVGISDLYAVFNAVYAKIDGLTSVEKKAELITILHTIQAAIDQMKQISLEYDRFVDDSELSLFESVLEEERSKFVRQREFNKIDMC